MITPRLGLRVAAVVLLGAGYVVASHWLMTSAPASPWNAVGVLAPMLAVLAVGAWRGGQHLLGGLAALAIAALAVPALAGITLPPRWLYAAQHIGINGFLAFVFGSTLRPGHTALITTLARRVHRQVTPAMAQYTRRCTLAWTLYFVGVAAVSLLLCATAPFATWAVFANLVSPISVGVMFAGEHWLRYRWHPEFERASVADAIRSYRAGAAEPAAARRDRPA